MTTSPQGMTDEALQAFCAAAPERIDSPLWTHLDWSLWGTGLGDTLREPMASAMVAAIPAEVRVHAEMVMAEFLKFRGVESRAQSNAELRAENKRLLLIVNELTADNAGLTSSLDAALAIKPEPECRHDGDCSEWSHGWDKGRNSALAEVGRALGGTGGTGNA